MEKERIENKIINTRNFLYKVQEEFETLGEDEDLIYQAIVVRQRISALLNIYCQMVCEKRKFNKDYLKKYGVNL